MALKLRDGFDDLHEHLQKLQEKQYSYLGECVIAGGDVGFIDADYFCIHQLPCSHQLSRIAMLFADDGMRSFVILEIHGDRTSRIESTGGSAMLLDMFLGQWNEYAAVPVDQLDGQTVTQPIRLIYSKPVFSSLLLHHHLLQHGYDIHKLRIPMQEQQMHDEMMREAILNLASTKDMLRTYFEKDTDRYDSSFLDYFLDHSVYERSLIAQIEELKNCLVSLELMRQETLDPNDDAGLEPMISHVKVSLQRSVERHIVEAPYRYPEDCIALWQVERKYPDNISYGDMVRIAVILVRELHTHSYHMPDKKHSGCYRLWQYYRSTLEQQLKQIESRMDLHLSQHNMDWSGYLL